MSNCIFIASDKPLPEVKPSQRLSFCTSIWTPAPSPMAERMTITAFYLFDEVDLYCKKKYGVYLELPQYTDGRARQIMDYIRAALLQTDCVEIWNVWLLGYWEYDDRPYIRKRTIRMEELTVDDMKEIINAENWDNKDKYRPSFYCLALVR